MTKQLTVHNAEVRTAAVEVRSLTISGKQVTLAVFRQLLEENPLTKLNEWKGVPWGFVNYLNDAPEAQRHVVWQKGTELRRGMVDNFVSDVKVIGGDLAHEWLATAVDGGWRSDSWREAYDGYGQRRAEWRVEQGPDKPLPRRLFSWTTHTDRHNSHYQDCRVGGFGGSEDWVIEASYDEAAALCVMTPDPKASTGRYTAKHRMAAVAAIEQTIRDVEANRERKRQRWQETVALDQLFIAV